MVRAPAPPPWASDVCSLLTEGCVFPVFQVCCRHGLQVPSCALLLSLCGFCRTCGEIPSLAITTILRALGSSSTDFWRLLFPSKLFLKFLNLASFIWKVLSGKRGSYVSDTLTWGIGKRHFLCPECLEGSKTPKESYILKSSFSSASSYHLVLPAYLPLPHLVSRSTASTHSGSQISKRPIYSLGRQDWDQKIGLRFTSRRPVPSPGGSHVPLWTQYLCI